MRCCVCLILLLCAGFAHAADYVIAVSVDAMGTGYMQTLVQAGRLPHFRQIEAEGAFTTNARNDRDFTVTLPNHISMLTSRPVLGPRGHRWSKNTDPAAGMTLHSNAACYVASVFDVAHDSGRRTGLWATKTKFSLFRVSYDGTHGAPDASGHNRGRNKLDVFVYRKTSPALVDDFLSSMNQQPCNFAFVHFGEADAAGHSFGWGSEAYDAALVTIDDCLGRIMDLMLTNANLRGRATLIVTADHGGKDKDHSDNAHPLDYTIPFLVWGAEVDRGDLYRLNANTRRDPGTGRPDYETQAQPIRNAEVGNLALSLLKLGPIPGSVFDARQDLRVATPTATGQRGSRGLSGLDN